MLRVSEVARRTRHNAAEPEGKKDKLGGMQDQTDPEILFEQAATIEAFQFVESTQPGKKPTDDTNKYDFRDFERLDRDDGGGTTGNKVGEVGQEA